MIVNFKKLHADAVTPSYAHNGDAGMDLTAVSFTQEYDRSGKLVIVYHTGIAVEIPEGYVGLIFMRSSVSKYSVSMTNAVAVIDSGYRGELMIKMKLTTDAVPTIYQPGEKMAQLVIVPYLKAELNEVEELAETERGEGGFGSTTEETNIAA